MGQLFFPYLGGRCPTAPGFFSHLSTETGVLLTSGTSQASWPHPSFLWVRKTQVEPTDLSGSLVPDAEKAKEAWLAPISKSQSASRWRPAHLASGTFGAQEPPPPAAAARVLDTLLGSHLISHTQALPWDLPSQAGSPNLLSVAPLPPTSRHGVGVIG